MEYCWNYKMENFSGKKLFLRNDGRIHWFVEKKFSHSFSFDILSILFVIFNNKWVKNDIIYRPFSVSLRSPCTNLPFRFLVSDVLYLSCAQASPEQNELCRRVSNTPSSPIRFSLSTVHFLSFFFFFIIRFYPIFLYNQSIQLNLI